MCNHDWVTIPYKGDEWFAVDVPSTNWRVSGLYGQRMSTIYLKTKSELEFFCSRGGLNKNTARRPQVTLCLECELVIDTIETFRSLYNHQISLYEREVSRIDKEAFDRKRRMERIDKIYKKYYS